MRSRYEGVAMSGCRDALFLSVEVRRFSIGSEIQEPSLKVLVSDKVIIVVKEK